MSEGGAALEAVGIEKAFGPNKVLRGVDLVIGKGTVHALLGENGAGKSTLVKILLGLERADAGEMRLGGVPYRPRTTAEARAEGVVLVPQERTLALHLTVAENVMLGVEPASFGGVVKRAEARALAEAAIVSVVGARGRIDLDAKARTLSVADQQLVEIARALAQGSSGGAKARVLLLDEPTSSLGQGDAERLFERVHALREEGLAVLLVTHFLSDVRNHTDRYTVLRDGKVQGEGDPKTTDASTIVHQMLGRELVATLGEREATPGEGETALEVRELAGARLPKRASFEVRRGEIVGIAGVVGSGRTELLRVVAGLDPKAAGTVTVRGSGQGHGRVGLLSEDRGGEGLMLARSIADNATLSARGPFVVRPAQANDEGKSWIERLGIRAPGGPTQAVGDLSGGNQQKVQLARLLREDFDVLLVDEPTRGIDVAAKAQVLALLRELARDKGKAVVLVSSQLDELVSTCDRIGVLKKGELGPLAPAATWTEEKLLLEAAS